tara:strand:+ start:19613 stop:20614 length:1002 start_codon:yes stop_codon:yes gene_type:complete
MVIGHIIKAVGKGSKIQTEKTIKTAQALVKANTGGGTQKEKEIAALRQMLQNAEQNRIKDTALSAAADKKRQDEVAALKTILQKANKQKQKGTGVKGGNTKNDKTIDKKIKQPVKEKAKVLKADKIRILKNKLPIVKRTGHYKQSTNKNQPLTPKGSGVNIAPLPKPDKKYQSMNGPTWASGWKTVKPSGLNNISWKPVSNTITAKDLKPFAFDAANKVISTEKKKIKFKKDLSSLDPWKKKDKVTGLGLGVGGAGMFALGTQPQQAHAEGTLLDRNDRPVHDPSGRNRKAQKQWSIKNKGVPVGYQWGSHPETEINAKKYLKKSKDERWGYW